ncbi:MAG: hypothetical protein ACE5JQ_17905 [Candidatus Methylomirabilales bacterium]
MSAVPAKCFQCQSDLRYDPINLRYRCTVCETGAPVLAGRSADKLVPLAERLGLESARLLSKVERWLGK